MDKLIKEINHALDMGRNRLQCYVVTKDDTHMVECKQWQEIAIYNINKLIGMDCEEV